MSFILIEYWVEDYGGRIHEYDDATISGPFDSLETVVYAAMEKMSDVFEPSVSFSCVDDEPWVATKYTPIVTKGGVTAELFEKKEYEIHGKKYVIRQLVV